MTSKMSAANSPKKRRQPPSLFTGDSEIGVLDAVRDCKIQSPRLINPELPETLEKIVFRALAKRPEERYQTAGEMEQDIQKLLHDLKPTP